MRKVSSSSYLYSFQGQCLVVVHLTWPIWPPLYCRLRVTSAIGLLVHRVCALGALVVKCVLTVLYFPTLWYATCSNSFSFDVYGFNTTSNSCTMAIKGVQCNRLKMSNGHFSVI